MNAFVLFLLFFATAATLFVLIGAPWMAARGPWVKYYVDIESVPDDADTAELYSQYPMLMFERQQHPSEMCLTRVSTTLWKTVFHLDPRVECHYEHIDHDRYYHRYRCVVWYCLSKWSVLTNNGTQFSHHVSVSMGHLYNLLVADACWFIWWAPAFVLFYFGCAKSSKVLFVALGSVYAVVAFGARVALSILAMMEFYRYDALTDPPHGGYVQNSTALQTFTTRSYGYGFICAWMVIVGNGIFILATFSLMIYLCVAGCDEFESNLDDARTRVKSIRKTSSRKRTPQSENVDSTAVATIDNTTDPYHKRTVDYDEPQVDVRLRSEEDQA